MLTKDAFNPHGHGTLSCARTISLSSQYLYLPNPPNFNLLVLRDLNS